jgi:CheY-like chemotaxis protein
MAEVLIVDDDRDTRQALRLALEADGYAVSEAIDGERALDQLRRATAPLVVLLDLLMPTLDGLGVLQAVAANPKLNQRHRYVVMTALRDRDLVPHTAQIGAVGATVLYKPFELDELLRVVVLLAT